MPEPEQRALRAAEEQYRQIFEATGDGLAINDPDTGVLVEANPAYCRMNGYTRDEMIGMHPTRFIHPEDHPLFTAYLRTALSGGVFQARARNVRKDGTVFDVEVRSSALMFRGKRHVLGVVRDISAEAEAYRLLESRVEERTRELEAVLGIARSLSSTLDLQALLELILDQLKPVLDYTGAGILALEGNELRVLGYRGPLPHHEAMALRFPLAEDVHDRFRRGEPLIIPDTLGSSPEAVMRRERIAGRPEEGFSYIRSWIWAPLINKGEIIGALSLEHEVPNHYNDRHATIALTIGAQAAIAIENARLFAQAQQVATLEERNRLARELHDSVSQALYGIALGARTARMNHPANPDEVTRSVEFIAGLADAGLAEMRALIFELRPESLRSEGLVAALEKNGEAIRARHQLEVELALGTEPELDLARKEALYRVAQEALNNIAKHAGAKHVRIELRSEPSQTMVTVQDDGVGFDPDRDYAGHLGLKSMRERMALAAGQLEVESAPGAGTKITATLPH